MRNLPASPVQPVTVNSLSHGNKLFHTAKLENTTQNQNITRMTAMSCGYATYSQTIMKMQGRDRPRFRIAAK
ncbi:hypothetical protein BD289DRAFT_65970 [Coniella lustricola]|uniref:Uncharacterized protein n=1 Tax=Coniella lustricola TaxID=2025994 RepID=A0A2T3AHW2_9PEZI|nr:hypothetical protein BD289DRAFT_65970 [Coniella lustricola]